MANNMGIPINLYKKLLKQFYDMLDTQLEELKTAINHKDYEQIMQISHKIKGAALNLHIDNMSEILQEIETNSSNKLDVNYEEYFDELLGIKDCLL